MPALRPSEPPASSELVGSTWGGEATARAKALPLSLRGGGVPRTLKPRRFSARQFGAGALDQSCVVRGVGNPTLAACIGLRSDREGAEARSGKLAITAGELGLLAPLPVMLDVFLEILTERISRERVSIADTTELRLALIHVDALRSLLIR